MSNMYQSHIIVNSLCVLVGWAKLGCRSGKFASTTLGRQGMILFGFSHFHLLRLTWQIEGFRLRFASRVEVTIDVLDATIQATLSRTHPGVL